MSLPVIVRPAAEADIGETYDYLEQIRAGLGAQFAAANGRDRLWDASPSR